MTGGPQGHALGASRSAATNEVVTVVPRRRAGVNTKHVILLLTAVLIASIGLTPLLVMVASSVTVDGSVSLLHYQTLLSSGRAWRLLGHSVALSFLTSLCA